MHNSLLRSNLSSFILNLNFLIVIKTKKEARKESLIVKTTLMYEGVKAIDDAKWMLCVVECGTTMHQSYALCNDRYRPTYSQY